MSSSSAHRHIVLRGSRVLAVEGNFLLIRISLVHLKGPSLLAVYPWSLNNAIIHIVNEIRGPQGKIPIRDQIESRQLAVKNSIYCTNNTL